MVGGSKGGRVGLLPRSTEERVDEEIEDKRGGDVSSAWESTRASHPSVYWRK